MPTPLDGFVEFTVSVYVTVGGAAYVAVTVLFWFMVTVQLLPVVDVHPVQDEKTFPLAVAGAVSVTVVPPWYRRVKLAEPLPLPFKSDGDTLSVTPVEGVDVFAVSV
jgi:hypothetical protein